MARARTHRPSRGSSMTEFAQTPPLAHQVFASDPPMLRDDDVRTILRAGVTFGGSDVHFTPGYPARSEINGVLEDLMVRPLTPDDTQVVVHATRGLDGISLIAGGRAVSYSFEIPAQEGKSKRTGVYRFRVEAAGCEYEGLSSPRVVFRYLPNDVPSLGQQNPSLPPHLQQALLVDRGLVLVVGRTGSGKSTLLAGVIRRIGTERPDMIMTFEEPIEFVYRAHRLKDQGAWRASVIQSEIGRHFPDWETALKSALRSAPKVLLLGEMRDQESILAALDFVSTGHALYSTMHVDGVASIPGAVAARAGHDDSLVQRVLGELSVAVYQRLAAKKDNTGRVAVREYLIMTPALKTTLMALNPQESKVAMIAAMVEAGTDLASEARRLLTDGVISEEEAHRVLGGSA